MFEVRDIILVAGIVPFAFVIMTKLPYTSYIITATVRISLIGRFKDLFERHWTLLHKHNLLMGKGTVDL